MSTASLRHSRWLKPPPAADRGLLDRAQARERLAGVAHLGPPVGRVHVGAGQRRDPGRVLEEVQRRALGREDGPQVPRDRGDDLAGLQPRAVVAVPVEVHRRVHLPEHLGGGGPAGEHARAPGDDRAAPVASAGIVATDVRSPRVPRSSASARVTSSRSTTRAGRDRRSMPGPPRAAARRPAARRVAEQATGEGVARLGEVQPRVGAAALLAGDRGRDQRPGDAQQVRQLVAGDGRRRRRRRATALATASRLAASRSTPAPTVIVCWSSGSVMVPASGTTAAGAPRWAGGAPRSTPVGSGSSLPAAIASTMRGANTSPSSRELDASRLAPCTPEHAASPHDQSPGRVDAPSRSVAIPPER